MSALSRILGAEYRSTSTLSNPSEMLMEAFAGGAMTFSGTPVSSEKAMQIPAVRAAIALVSRAISLCPLKVYRDGEDGTQEEAPDHRAWAMLHDKPNGAIPADLYWQMVVRQLLRHGNSFHEKRRNLLTGLVNELRPMDPVATRVQWNAATSEKTFVVEDQNGRRVYSNSDVLHIVGDSDNGLLGRSPIDDCRESLGIAIARQQFEGSFYQRAAVFAGVIQHPGKLGGEGAIDRLRKAFGLRYEGSRKAFGTPVLEEGAELNVPRSPLESMQLNEAELRTRTDIALMFNIPPSYLAGAMGDSLTYSTVEGNAIQFARFAVAPWANRIAKALSADSSIFPFSSWYAEFVLEGLMRGDAKSRAEVYQTLFNLKDGEGRRALGVDEIRALENRGPAEAEAQPQPAALPADQPVDSAQADGQAPTPPNLVAMRG